MIKLKITFKKMGENLDFMSIFEKKNQKLGVKKNLKKMCYVGPSSQQSQRTGARHVVRYADSVTSERSRTVWICSHARGWSRSVPSSCTIGRSRLNTMNGPNSFPSINAIVRSRSNHDKRLRFIFSLNAIRQSKWNMISGPNKRKTDINISLHIKP